MNRTMRAPTSWSADQYGESRPERQDAQGRAALRSGLRAVVASGAPRPGEGMDASLAHDREAQGGFQDLVPEEARADAEVEPGDAPGQLPRQLHSPAPNEQVHDREVVRLAGRRLNRLGAGP